MTAKERVLLVIQTKGTNVNALSKVVGIPQGTLAYQLKRDSIQINFIEGLLRAFPDISPDWLIMGEGNMYRTSAADQYHALVDTMAELHKKHEAELLEIIAANQRSGSVNISNIGNTTINNNNNNDNGKDE